MDEIQELGTDINSNWEFKDGDLNELQILELKEEFWQSRLDKTLEFLNTEEWKIYAN